VELRCWSRELTARNSRLATEIATSLAEPSVGPPGSRREMEMKAM
jgi:hypothetical protein